jgi:hypothetical protein
MSPKKSWLLSRSSLRAILEGDAGFLGDVRSDFVSLFEGAFVGRTGRAAVASSQPETVALAPWPAANGDARPPAEGDF